MWEGERGEGGEGSGGESSGELALGDEEVREHDEWRLRAARAVRRERAVRRARRPSAINHSVGLFNNQSLGGE